MDKEAVREITEFAEMLYNFREAMTIQSIEHNLESFLLASHYRKLPSSPAPMLSDGEIKKIVKPLLRKWERIDRSQDQRYLDEKITTERYRSIGLRIAGAAERTTDGAIAKAQHRLSEEHYRGKDKPFSIGQGGDG